MYGTGRVFYSSFGHAAATWDNPAVATMYFEAIKWSLGLSDADVTPRPYRAGVNAANARRDR
jgi:type 1 glutamine amidotransferase